MTQEEDYTLKEELEHFRSEKEKIRQLVGEVGGKGSARRDKTITTIFITFIFILFLLDILRHLLKVSIPLPPLFSIQLGVLFVSVKIIWMIHKQSKLEHFQFWILNSIEFRLNELALRLSKMEKKFSKMKK